MPKKPHPHKPPPPVPPLPPFFYEPASAVVKWQDKNGVKSGDLSNFNNTADKASVIDLNLANQGVTKLGLGAGFPMLQRLDVRQNQLSELPSLAASPGLLYLFCKNNLLKSLPSLSGNTLIRVLDFGDNQIDIEPDVTKLSSLYQWEGENNRFTTINWGGNPELLFANAYGLPVTTVSISTNRKLRNLDMGGNPLTVPTVDHLINKLAEFGLSNGALLLFDTATPSPSSATSIAALRSRSWELQLDT